MTVHLFNARDSAMRATRRMERKFYVTPKEVGIAQGLLRQVCRPDGEYPIGLVNSLYFDTFDLDEYQDSQSGDFGKDKVRIRWYGEGGNAEGGSDRSSDRSIGGRSDRNSDGVRTIYIELKSKEGFASAKQRLELQVPAYRLAMPHLAHGIVPKAVLEDVLASFGHFPAKMLYPVVRVSYRRFRFTEPLTGQRVALDCRIRSTMVGPRFGNCARELELAGAVVEIKGTSIELPGMLRRIGLLDVDWSRFSKYSACIEAHDERLGTIGRLSPSGRMCGLPIRGS